MIFLISQVYLGLRKKRHRDPRGKNIETDSKIYFVLIQPTGKSHPEHQIYSLKHPTPPAMQCKLKPSLPYLQSSLSQLPNSLRHNPHPTNLPQLSLTKITSRKIPSPPLAPPHNPNIKPTIPLPLLQHPKPESHFSNSNSDTDNDEYDDDPCYGTHFCVRDGIGQDFGEVEKDAAALVEDFGAGFYFEVFADGVVERMEGGFGVPEEVGDIEDVGCWGLLVDCWEEEKARKGGTYRDLHPHGS
jgi:hypothetical protein